MTPVPIADWIKTDGTGAYRRLVNTGVRIISIKK